MTQFNTPTYDIQRPTGRCAFSDRVLEPGEDFIVTLVEMTDEEIEAMRAEGKQVPALGLKRLDVSMERWAAGDRPRNIFSYWKTTVPEPNQKKKLFVDDDVLMNLVKRLEDTEDRERLAFRFVVALILMRKKLLVYEGSEKRETKSEEGDETLVEEWWIMKPRKEDERIHVLNPRLDETKIQQVSDQLGEILESEL